MALTTMVLAAAPPCLLLWLGTRRRACRAAGLAASLPIADRRRLFADPLCSLRDVTLTEVVALGDDVLVAHQGGRGSWFTAGSDDGSALRVVEAGPGWGGPFLLPGLVQDARAMDLLRCWRDDRTRLVSMVPRGAGLVVIADRRRRAVIAVALRPSPPGLPGDGAP